MKGNKESLISVGHVNNSSSTDIEWMAAEMAAKYAKEMGVSLVKGDFKACLKGMREKHPKIKWEWIPSKSNPADKYAKYYPELV